MSVETKKPKTKPWLRWLFRLGITLIFLLFVVRFNVDPKLLGQELAGANLWLIALSVGLVQPLIAVKAWRWHYLLGNLGIHLPFGTVYRLHGLGVSAASFTPGQSGDFIKAWHLKRAGWPLGLALVSIVLDRLFDILVLMVLALISLVALGMVAFESALPGLVLLLAAVAAGLVVLAVPTLREPLLGQVERMVEKLGRKLGRARTPDLEGERASLEPADRPGETGREANQVELEIPPVGTNLANVNYLPAAAITLLGTVVVLGRVWLLALALNLNLTPLQIVAVSSLATVASLVPVSLGGLGPRELILVTLLTGLGYSAEKAASLSLFLALLQLVSLVAGYLIWLRRPAEAVYSQSEIRPAGLGKPG